MFHGIFLATFILALFTLVSASLYPTQPIQSTVYYAGETALTTWIDDGSFPLLSNMGDITIQLYTKSDIFLATLATNVDPLVQSYNLSIPRWLVYDGSNFTLRYLTDTPYNMTIYSADFTFVVRGDSIPNLPSPLGSFPSSTDGLVSSQAGLATVSEAENSGPTSIVIPPLLPSSVGGFNQPSGKSKNSAAGRLDTEKLKFRLVFILWPAVLGITLAL
ncbi:hypothetical protein AZE42_09617 [Rhizopogon vesiculosus]|uniref:Uncharacterized protein n=1 Tax=Rhizopogon vesiculosus TaxID=180088 RepID=A0A1J8Q8J7_9AGAM|nr:hypothetical protein AZE42_09617 [Rhizopogon vesiculosus]